MQFESHKNVVCVRCTVCYWPITGGALVLVASLLVANQTVSVTVSHLFRVDFFTYKGFSIGTDMISAFWP